MSDNVTDIGEKMVAWTEEAEKLSRRGWVWRWGHNSSRRYRVWQPPLHHRAAFPDWYGELLAWDIEQGRAPANVGRDGT